MFHTFQLEGIDLERDEIELPRLFGDRTHGLSTASGGCDMAICQTHRPLDQFRGRSFAVGARDGDAQAVVFFCGQLEIANHVAASQYQFLNDGFRA